jgi:hypothetical protein
VCIEISSGAVTVTLRLQRTQYIISVKVFGHLVWTLFLAIWIVPLRFLAGCRTGLYKSIAMPLYEFKYEDSEGETHYFDDFMSYDALKKTEEEGTLLSPCGNYRAERVMSIPHLGAEGPTRAEKEAFVPGKKTLSERRDLASHVRNMRDERKRNADPNDKLASSNALWTGKEDLSGVVRRKAPLGP